jgi:ribosome-associated translation inhibitor RaiA
MPTERDYFDVPQTEFIERGLKSAEQASRTGIYVTPEEVVAKLEATLRKHKQKNMRRS